ncbi:Hypothetical_protein [Hexamita inflata]|uniref:Hypothetical_protein n=1 Tax=Hexamita inflata TaxID=28002 RepID=A0AA86PSQ5_9EUKA|nr:Hypothetical protein HINF_LOCUS32721 [Hexamita inflata]
MNSVQIVTVNQVNTNLQNQIDGTKNDVRTIQSSITGINGLINNVNGQISNINNVNAAQSADIQALKNQAGQNMNGAFWCSMLKINQQYISVGYSDSVLTSLYIDRINGYCSNLRMCCNEWSYSGRIYYSCATAANYWSAYTNVQCGTFVQI